MNPSNTIRALPGCPCPLCRGATNWRNYFAVSAPEPAPECEPDCTDTPGLCCEPRLDAPSIGGDLPAVGTLGDYVRCTNQPRPNGPPPEGAGAQTATGRNATREPTLLERLEKRLVERIDRVANAKIARLHTELECALYPNRPLPGTPPEISRIVDCHADRLRREAEREVLNALLGDAKES